MNTGIQDAVALGKALGDVLHGNASDARLDEYERIRRPVAERVVAFTDRLTRIATLRSSRGRAARNTALGLVAKIPVLPRALATELAGLNNR